MATGLSLHLGVCALKHVREAFSEDTGTVITQSLNSEDCLVMELILRSSFAMSSIALKQVYVFKLKVIQLPYVCDPT